MIRYLARKIETKPIHRVTVTFDVRADTWEAALEAVQVAVDDMPAWNGGPIVDRVIRSVD